MIFDIFVYAVLIAYYIRTIRQILFHVYLWQLKEYRIDRIKAHLHTDQGKRLIFSFLSLSKWLLFLVIYILPHYQSGIIIFSFYLFWLIWIAEMLSAIRDLYFKKWRIPKFSLKSLIIIFVSLFFLFYPLIYIYWTAPLILAPILDKLLAPVIALIVLSVNIPFALYKQFILRIAAAKITASKVQVIGITGSYGKTSTKEFLGQIMKAKYNILKTPDSVNTQIGIAQFVNNNLSSGHDFFIAEIGAYKKGEIKSICRFLKPGIGVITSIGNQHIELFGSIERLASAKYELIESLPQFGIAVINSGNKYLTEIAAKAKQKVNTVEVIDKINSLKNLKTHKKFLEFDFILQKSRHHFRADLPGVQHLDNLLLAISTARLLKVPVFSIKKSVKELKSPAKTMQIIRSSAKLTLIDDTFNVNFEGVKAGILYLNNYRGLKALFLNPIIELGKDAPLIHIKLGEIAGDICNIMYVTNLNYIKDLRKGIESSGKKLTKVYYADKNSVFGLFNKLTVDSVVLFAGKETAKWIPFFKKNNI